MGISNSYRPPRWYILCYNFIADIPNIYDRAFRPDQIIFLYKFACFHACRTGLLEFVSGIQTPKQWGSRKNYLKRRVDICIIQHEYRSNNPNDICSIQHEYHGNKANSTTISQHVILLPIQCLFHNRFYGHSTAQSFNYIFSERGSKVCRVLMHALVWGSCTHWYTNNPNDI